MSSETLSLCLRVFVLDGRRLEALFTCGPNPCVTPIKGIMSHEWWCSALSNPPPHHHHLFSHRLIYKKTNLCSWGLIISSVTHCLFCVWLHQERREHCLILLYNNSAWTWGFELFTGIHWLLLQVRLCVYFSLCVCVAIRFLNTSICWHFNKVHRNVNSYWGASKKWVRNNLIVNELLMSNSWITVDELLNNRLGDTSMNH